MHFRIDERFKKLIQNFVKCNNNSIECDTKLEPKMKEFFKNRYIFIVNK